MYIFGRTLLRKGARGKCFTLSVAIFRNFTIPGSLPPLIPFPNVAKCKWEKVYDAHLAENGAVNVAQLGLMGTAFSDPI